MIWYNTAAYQVLTPCAQLLGEKYTLLLRMDTPVPWYAKGIFVTG